MATLSIQNTIPAKTETAAAPLRIVIIVTYAHPYIGSGLGVVAKFQAEYLASQGHHVTLVSSNIPRTSQRFELNGVTYIKVPALALLERLHIPVPILFFNTSVISAIRDADIVHIHDILYPSSFVAALLAKQNKKRVILTQHVPHVEYANKIINAIEKLAFYTMGLATLRASDAALVLNTTVHKWIKQYKKEVHQLPNGVDFRLFNKPTEQEKQSIREQYNLPLDKFIVLFVGRFVPKKGFDILYNAKDPSYLLVFVGGGIIPEQIKSDDSVRIVGPLPQEDLARMYKASDAFILPSYGEGFPLAIQEAMATGLPIITSKQNNLDQTLDSPLISYIDIAEADIKSAIKKLQSNPKQQQEMSEYSSQVARENYSWEKNITRLLDIYKSNETMLNPASTHSNPISNTSSARRTILNIVAHEDDDLIFLNPDLLQFIRAGHNVRTIFVTAGDGGKDADYWRKREVGARAAYAQMCGVTNAWTQADAGIDGHPIQVFTLIEHPSVSLAFMRLPDGNLDGSGFSSTNYEALQKLWTSEISTINAVDGSSSYTKAALTSTLVSLMDVTQPDQVNTQDYIGSYGDGDHSDHHSVAYLVRSALETYARPCSLTGYAGYNVSRQAANVTKADLAAKRKAFYTYARHDPDLDFMTLRYVRSSYVQWLKRQYNVGSVVSQEKVMSHA